MNLIQFMVGLKTVRDTIKDIQTGDRIRLELWIKDIKFIVLYGISSLRVH